MSILTTIKKNFKMNPLKIDLARQIGRDNRTNSFYQNSTDLQVDENRAAELLEDYQKMMNLLDKIQNTELSEKLVNEVVEEVRTSRYRNKNRKVSIKRK